MIRAVVLTIVLLAGRSASGFEIDIPLIPSTCGTPLAWDAQAACLGRQGTVTVLHDSNAVKVVRITTPGTTPRDLGMYLYAQRAALWHLSGMFEGGNES